MVELIWILPLTIAVLNAVGMLPHRPQSSPDATAIDQMVVFFSGRAISAPDFYR